MEWVWQREHGLGTHDNTIPLPRFLFIIALVMVTLVFICGLVGRFCPTCGIEQHDIRTGDHQTTPEPPSNAPLESIWVTSLDPPPPYSQVCISVPVPNVFHSRLLNMLSDWGRGIMGRWWLCQPYLSIFSQTLNKTSIPFLLQVVLNPTPTEPPPPYSRRPEGPAGQMRGNAYATL